MIQRRASCTDIPISTNALSCPSLIEQLFCSISEILDWLRSRIYGGISLAQAMRSTRFLPKRPNYQGVVCGVLSISLEFRFSLLYWLEPFAMSVLSPTAVSSSLPSFRSCIPSILVQRDLSSEFGNIVCCMTEVLLQAGFRLSVFSQ